MRNRFIFGESIELTPGYADNTGKDPGLIDLSFNLMDEKSFLLNTTFDRIFIKYENGPVVLTLGRQRINWGINSVWNPNDIFNVQNFFDFDYIEKPGSDAVRLQYYTGEASSAEFVIKSDNENRITSGLFYRFNEAGYDFQVLGGIFNSNDLVLGTGFSGHLFSAGLKGEFSYFSPLETAENPEKLFLGSIGADYMSGNSIYFQFEALVRKSQSGGDITNFLEWYSYDLNVKKLAFTDFSLFGSASYPFTPLFSGNLSMMYFPGIKGFFSGPVFSLSIYDNFEVSLISQIFSGVLPDNTGKESRNNLFLGFLRLKYNFG
jgi:hypothetical protein